MTESERAGTEDPDAIESTSEPQLPVGDSLVVGLCDLPEKCRKKVEVKSSFLCLSFSRFKL